MNWETAARQPAVVDALRAALGPGTDLDAELPKLMQQLAEAFSFDAVVFFDAADGHARTSVGLSPRGPSPRLPTDFVLWMARQSGVPQRLSVAQAALFVPGVEVSAGEVLAFELPDESRRGKPPGVLMVARRYGGISPPERDAMCAVALELGRALSRRSASPLAAPEDRIKLALLDAALDAIVVVDNLGTLQEFNPAAENLFGHRRADVLGQNMSDLLVPPRYRSAHMRGMERFRGTGYEHVVGRRLEVPALRADGSEFMAELSLVRVPGQEPAQFAAFLRDISDRKRAEAALRSEQARFSAVFEFAPDAVLILDVDGRILMANRSAEKTFGLPRAELTQLGIGDVVGDATSDSPGASGELLPPTTVVEESRTNMSSGTRPAHEARRKDGSRVPIEMNLSPIELDEGLRVVAVIRDVSARLKSQKDRARLEEQLRQAQKMQSLGTLAGGVAHYFNNVLAAILANVELLRDVVDPTPTVTEHLDMIAAASGRGRDLVKQILAFSRQTPSRRVVTSLVGVVEEVVQLLRATIPAGIELVLTTAPKVPNVQVDPTQIHQTFLNLATNAWHAIERPTGRITLDVDTLNLSPSEGSDLGIQPGRYARVRVSDTGVGMSEATVKRIFEPFFTTKTVGHGTGLGLAEAHGIVSEHGGGLTVSSQMGDGTTFTVLLPAVDAPLVTKDRAPSRPPMPRGAAHVLLIDDEEPLLRVGKRLLERQGYQVTGFSNPEQAVAAFQASPETFHILVTDQNMPRMTGVEVITALRATQPNLPVLLLSGNGYQIREDGKLARVHRLDKPFTGSTLAIAIATALEDG